ncbi:virulence factor TspB C-terminal domain-related protein [Agarivorans litoreus]|uniref:virulence factor TspB C-terminal domain-related protein n=1 Tax=Agarivorans litoreus TaxID=1510455 RepID=UPI001C7DC962|nr:virulence factor TspB C-terminal domain-related protein [Agarivorans litoreus]
MRNFLYGLFYTFSLGFVVTIPAQAANNWTYTPVKLDNVVRTSSGVAANLTIARNLLSNTNQRFFKQALTISKAGISAAARLRMASPFGLALQAGIYALGYDQYDDPSVPEKYYFTESGVMSFGRCAAGGDIMSIDECLSMTAEAYPTANFEGGWYLYSGTEGKIHSKYRHSSNIPSVFAEFHFLYSEDSEIKKYFSTDQFNELLDSLAPFSLLDNVLTDPSTGYPYNIPEVRAAVSLVANYDIENNYEGDPADTPDITIPDESTPSDGSPSEVPDTGELPVFCTWATGVCEFMEWFRQEPDEIKAIPTEDYKEDVDLSQLEQSFSSGIGSGSCPAPYTYSVDFAGVTKPLEFDYTPMCEFVSLARIWVIISAWVGAAFIVSGQRMKS